LVLTLALAAVAFFIGRNFAPRPAGPATTETAIAETRRRLYQCSMHPQIVSDKPGKCPICGMNLEPVEEAQTLPIMGAPKEHKILFYRNPMRADVTSPTPTKDEMGMDYIPVYADELAGAQTEVPGHAGFTLSTEREQLIGVTRGKVELRDLNTDIRTVGQVAYDPDLYQTIVEYQQTLHREGLEAVTGAAALRLRQMGLSDEMIKELADPGYDPRSLLLPGKEVWVYAQLYEYEVDLVQPGQPVSVSAPSVPSRIYTAKVAAVDPILNATTRTARARILVATPDDDLRPGMFVHVNLEIPLGRKLAVPFDAVLDTGENQIVFAVKGAGTFEPRSVKLGRQADGYYEVLSGVEEGEEVVTSANFLIDSESRFRSALAAFGKKLPAFSTP
jgi:Cu(I)/Ag(I) efflux system membrane fusion protein